MHNNKGYVPGLDGRKLWTRSEHSAMNTLFQGAGAILMSNAIVNYREVINQMIKDGIQDADKLKQVIFYHDEVAIDFVQEHHKEPLTIGATRAMQKAGEDLDFRLELGVDVQFGQNWGEIH